MYEIELHYPSTQNDEARVDVLQVEASCITELANIAYSLQTRGGYRTVRNPLTGKTRVVGLQIEYVSFGPVVERDEDGLTAYNSRKR